MAFRKTIESVCVCYTLFVAGGGRGGVCEAGGGDGVACKNRQAPLAFLWHLSPNLHFILLRSGCSRLHPFSLQLPYIKWNLQFLFFDTGSFVSSRLRFLQPGASSAGLDGAWTTVVAPK